MFNLFKKKENIKEISTLEDMVNMTNFKASSDNSIQQYNARLFEIKTLIDLFITNNYILIGNNSYVKENYQLDLNNGIINKNDLKAEEVDNLIGELCITNFILKNIKNNITIKLTLQQIILSNTKSHFVTSLEVLEMVEKKYRLNIAIKKWDSSVLVEDVSIYHCDPNYILHKHQEKTIFETIKYNYSFHPRNNVNNLLFGLIENIYSKERDYTSIKRILPITLVDMPETYEELFPAPPPPPPAFKLNQKYYYKLKSSINTDFNVNNVLTVIDETKETIQIIYEHNKQIALLEKDKYDLKEVEEVLIEKKK